MSRAARFMAKTLRVNTATTGPWGSSHPARRDSEFFQSHGLPGIFGFFDVNGRVWLVILNFWGPLRASGGDFRAFLGRTMRLERYLQFLAPLACVQAPFFDVMRLYRGVPALFAGFVAPWVRRAAVW